MSSKCTLLCVVVYIVAVVSSKRTETAEPNLSLQKSRWPTHASVFEYYLKLRKPWLLLPDNNRCYHHKCDSSDDCCRSFSICDRATSVCIDCWYKYPCLSDGDCCEMFPVCSKEATQKSYLGTEYGMCY
ncbi:hypothetical protein NP493_115g11014 [Ridgeia piscesae]|uniref:Uncharacterized protein n=1 Tax=Ridgeia piscesae TaxID=27915 RepID=A0AAD9P6K5_RIDPI|nr:hypothetical protein NP493_115g11014 [Ridgeia piscesae]